MVDSNVTIKQALGIMMRSRAEAMFVVDADSRLVGLVSSYDIQSEKPLRYLQSIGHEVRSCACYWRGISLALFESNAVWSAYLTHCARCFRLRARPSCCSAQDS